MTVTDSKREMGENSNTGNNLSRFLSQVGIRQQEKAKCCKNQGKNNRFGAEILDESKRIFIMFDIKTLMCPKQRDKVYRPYGSLGKRSF